RLEQGDRLAIEDLHRQLEQKEITVLNKTKDFTFAVRHNLTPRLLEIVKAGGLLNYTKNKNSPSGDLS
ncbi:MAG TPA: hypothetical protein PLC75_06695, partial [Bacillota bacterium]|nr:hypothetical protein [Bacillota bacterium]